MANILIVTAGLAGILNTSLAMASRLVNAGHKVRLASPDPIAKTVAETGIEFDSLEPDGLDLFWRSDGLRPWFRRVKDRTRRLAEGVEALSANRSVDWLAAQSPDLTLIDLELHDYVMAFVGAGHRVAVLTPWMSAQRGRGVPALHTLNWPGSSWRGAPWAIDLAWRKWLMGKRLRRWQDWLSQAGVTWPGVLQAHARRHGFAYQRHVDPNHWPIPFLYPRLPLVHLQPWSFEFPHDPPGSVFYVGPLIDSDRPALLGDAEGAARLTRLLDQRDETRPLIAIALGSFFPEQSEFLGRLAEVFRLRPTLDGVIGLGPTWRDVSSGFPANLRGFEWVSQPRVFAKADAVIHHGGINTCVEAASYGLPMLAYTPGVRDMHGTVSRMAYHGLGLIGDRDKDSPQTIAQCLDHILADPTIRERADHMKKALEAERARSVLEQTIDGLLRAPLTPRHRAGD